LGKSGVTLMFLAAMLAIPAHGQGLESVRKGARVRLASDGSEVIGILADHKPDTLWIRLDRTATLQPFALSRVQRFEVSRERRSNAGRMAFGGLIVGAVPGLVAGVACDCGEPGLAAVLFGAVTGGLGAAIGAGLGATSRHDVWEPIPLPSAPESPAPVSEGADVVPSWLP
jgi:hypothetical protein